MSEQQTRVLRLLAEGYTNREIASELTIGLRTAESYVSGVLYVLGAPNRTAAVHEAHRRGLL